MILGGMSLSEEPLSSQAGEQVIIAFSTSGDLPIDTAPYYIVAAKALCWTVDGDSDLDWILENCEADWVLDNTCS